MSGVIEFLTELLRFFADLFSRRREDRDGLWDRIQEVQKSIVLALEEGRVSDIPPLRKELSRLMREYSKYVKSVERKLMKNVVKTVSVAVLAASALCCGCLSWRGSGGQETVFVLGDRINLVEPGSVVEVPDLISPAKQWYLVDNVGLQHWLGIPVGLEGQEEPRSQQ